MIGRSGEYVIARAALLMAAAMMLLIGCASEKEAAVDSGILTSGEVIERVNALSSSITTYSASGSLSIETPQISQSAGFEIAIRKPDSVMITVDGPFGITLGKALFTTETFTAYNALNNTVYEGNSRRGMQSLPFFTGVQPEVIIDAMSGVRRFNNGFSTPDSFSAGTTSYRFQFTDSSLRTQITVDARSLRITSVRTFQNDSTLLWEEFYSYTAGDSLFRPDMVRINIPRRSTVIEFFFDDVSMNQILPAFVLEYPDDADRITIN